MLLLRNAIFRYTKNCGHAAAQKCYLSGTKKTLWACYCSEMLFFRYKEAPAGMLLLRNAIFLGTKKPLWACYCSEMQFFGYNKSPCGHVTAQKCHFLGTKKAPAGM